MPLPGQSGHHAVQFYSEDRILCGAVADFLGDGLAAGQPVVVIATRKHRDAIARELKTRNFDVDALVQRGDVTLFDAAETLQQLLVDDRPDPARFETVFAPALDAIYRDRPDCVVRAYGEMVDLLWRTGNHGGAFRLEQMWTDLVRSRRMSVICGYGLTHFYRDTAGLQALCDLHTHNEIIRAGNA